MKLSLEKGLGDYMVQPHEKTMKVQWIEVDGRSVPLVLPQYWDNELEEWIVTGTDNPLQVDARLIGSNVEQDVNVLNYPEIQKISSLKETYSVSRSLKIEAGTTELIEEYPFPCELTSFSIGTSDRRVSIRIENKLNGSYDNGIRLVHPSGSSTNPVSPTLLETLGGENDFWREFVYSRDDNRFSLGMKRIAIFSQGMRIRLSATVESDVALTYMVTRMEG